MLPVKERYAHDTYFTLPFAEIKKLLKQTVYVVYEGVSVFERACLRVVCQIVKRHFTSGSTSVWLG